MRANREAIQLKLTGNTIFITGGGSGIGRGPAEALLKLVQRASLSRPALETPTAALHDPFRFNLLFQ